MLSERASDIQCMYHVCRLFFSKHFYEDNVGLHRLTSLSSIYGFQDETGGYGRDFEGKEQ